jgi:hypothetical protein
MTIAHKHTPEIELYLDSPESKLGKIPVRSNADLLDTAYRTNDPGVATLAIEAVSDIDHARRLQAYVDIYEKYQEVLSANEIHNLEVILREDAYRLLTRHLPFKTVERIGVPSVRFEDADSNLIVEFRDVVALSQAWELLSRDVVIAKSFLYIFEKMANNTATTSEADLFEKAFIASLENGQTILDNRLSIINRTEEQYEITKKKNMALAATSERNRKRRATAATRLSDYAIDDTMASLPVTK